MKLIMGIAYDLTLNAPSAWVRNRSSLVLSFLWIDGFQYAGTSLEGYSQASRTSHPFQTILCFYSL